MQSNTAATSPSGLSSVTPDFSKVWETIDGMVDGFFAILPNVVIGVVIFAVFWIVAKVIQKVVVRTTRNYNNAGLASVLSRLAYWILLIVGLLIAATIIIPSMTPGKLISTLGIGGVAIGFAFKDIFQNLLAGILILLRQPFKVGDEITSGKFTGTVEAIETRATFIKSYDGIRVIIPNSQIYQEPIEVITAYDMVRSEYDLGIGYGDNIGEALEISLRTLKSIDGIMKDPAPDAYVWALAGSSINLRLRWWTNPRRPNVVATYSEVLKQVSEALAEAAIDIPFPTQVVLFHDQTEDIDGDRTKQREGWPAGKNPPKPARLEKTKE